MAKAVVIYESKYGNTKTVAESIAEGIREGGVGDALVLHVGAVNLADLSTYDVLVIGSPNHVGGATRSVKKLINSLSGLSGKLVAAFDTYMGSDVDKAVNKMIKQLKAKAPGLEVISPGLSVLVSGMKGSIADGEVEKSKTFGGTIATRLIGGP
ncbi:flavodoxin family protein [Candidatus Bipolaricaulota bacterium]